MQLAYLYSRYPVISQTFCDMEMLELERRGYDLRDWRGTSAAYQFAARTYQSLSFSSPLRAARPGDGSLGGEGQGGRALAEGPHQAARTQIRPGLQSSVAGAKCLLFRRLFHPARGPSFSRSFRKPRRAHGAFPEGNFGHPVQHHRPRAGFHVGSRRRTICSGKFARRRNSWRSRPTTAAACCGSAVPTRRKKSIAFTTASTWRICLCLRRGNDRRVRPPFSVWVGWSHSKASSILLEACAELDRRNFDFRCQIVGDGPLREKLETMIAELKLRRRVELCGSLSQEDVFSKLRGCDIFALASVVDAAGASDVFPTVIMEAMACAKPVVSTTLAGIPESVVDGVTGLLVPPGIGKLWPAALDKLVRDRGLRARFGEAGRARMTSEFDVVKTVEPLHQLFTSCLSTSPVRKGSPSAGSGVKQAAYLIDRWPDPNLPLLEMELRALQRNKVPHVALVVHPPIAVGAHRTDERSRHAIRISAGCDGDRGRMAGQHDPCPGIGNAACQPKTSSAIGSVFGADSLGAGLTEIAPAMQYRARACHQFPHIVRRTDLEETSRH